MQRYRPYTKSTNGNANTRLLTCDTKAAAQQWDQPQEYPSKFQLQLGPEGGHLCNSTFQT